MTEHLFWCQQKVVYNLIYHPVKDYRQVSKRKRREQISLSNHRPCLLSFVKTTALELDLLCLLCLTVTALKTTLSAPPTLFFWRAARYADVSRFSVVSLR